MPLLKKYSILFNTALLCLIFIVRMSNAQESIPAKELDELKRQIASLKEEIAAQEIENEFLTAILRAQAKYLKPPELAKADEKNLEKVIHLNLGFAYGLKGNLKDAIEEYRRALGYDPENKDIHYNLGYLLSEDNSYEEAIAEYKQALAGLPQDREVYYNLAVIYTSGLNDQKTGDEFYRRFLALSPANSAPSLQTEKALQRH